jgi:hypothetical protein
LTCSGLVRSSKSRFCLGDESKWQPFLDFTEGHDCVVVWLKIPTGRVYVLGMECFLSLEKAGVVTVRRDAQVIRWLDVVVATCVRILRLDRTALDNHARCLHNPI